MADGELIFGDSAMDKSLSSACVYNNIAGDFSDQEFGSELGDYDLNDIDQLLENPIGDVPEKLKNARKCAKRVLVYRGQDHFDVLPDGWVEVSHDSGLPVYLHQKSRCCTFSRPYFIGRASSRKHRVPESAVPCLFYKRLQMEAEQCGDQATESQAEGRVGNDDGRLSNRNEILQKLNAPAIQVKKADDIAQMTPGELHEYAQRRLKFKNINIYRFDNWKDKRDHDKRRKRSATEANPMAGDSSLRPGLSGNAMMITIPSVDNSAGPLKKSFRLNPLGKNSVCILHDVAQKVLRCSVEYFYSETRNVAMPHRCVAKLPYTAGKQLAGSSIKNRLVSLHDRSRLNGIQANADDDKYVTIGEGSGNGKKEARLMAAMKAVQKLLGGEIEFDSDYRCVANQKSNATVANSLYATDDQVEEEKFQILDNLDVCDSRVAEWCLRAGQPVPYLILEEYLKRNATFGDTEIRTSIQMGSSHFKFKKHRFDMYVGGSHHISVECGNKREGKQKAAQAMLSKFMPECTTWGSILRLYGYEAQQRQRESVKSKKSLVKLQEKVRLQNEKIGTNFEPNNLLLGKLKSEMLKISTDLVKGQIKSAQTSDNGVCPAKRARLEAAASFAQLSAAQIDALEALLHAQKARLRNEAINFSDMPILDEGQMRELSGKLSQIFPNSDVKVPSLN